MYKQICTFILFFCFSKMCGQDKTKTDQEILSEEEQVLEGLLSGDLLKDFQDIDGNFDFIYFSFDYNNKTYFSGRDIGVDQYSITPQITYINSNGFFGSVSGVYFSALNPKWDFTSISLGYGRRFGKQKQYRWSASYDRFFFSQSANNPFKNGLNVGAEWDNKTRTLGAEITSSFLFGQDESFQIVGAVYGELILFPKKIEKLKLRPEINFIVGQQTVELARTFTIKNRDFIIFEQSDDFGWINTQLSIPLQYSISNLDMELGYDINFPSPLKNETNLKITGTFTFSIAYLLDL